MASHWTSRMGYSARKLGTVLRGTPLGIGTIGAGGVGDDADARRLRADLDAIRARGIGRS